MSLPNQFQPIRQAISNRNKIGRSPSLTSFFRKRSCRAQPYPLSNKEPTLKKMVGRKNRRPLTLKLMGLHPALHESAVMSSSQLLVLLLLWELIGSEQWSSSRAAFKLMLLSKSARRMPF